MEVMKTEHQIRYSQARKQVREIRNFYVNLCCYCVVIPTLIVINLMNYNGFYWFVFSMLGWGIGLLVHAMEAFNFNPFYNKEWENRKIEKFLQEELSKQSKINGNGSK